MPEPQFNLSPNAFDELAALAKHADQIREITRLINEADPSLNRKEILRTISDQLNLPQDEARATVRALLNLHSTITAAEIKPNQLVDSLTRTFESAASDLWREANLGNWKKSSEAIVDGLLAIDPDSTLDVISKERRVANAHQNLYIDSCIYTALRPVFNRNADNIKRMMVYNELVLTYVTESQGRQELQLTLDETDIIELKKQCERAQLKSATVNRLMVDCSWETYILNDPHIDESGND